MEKKPLVFFWTASRFSNYHTDIVIKMANALSDLGIASCIATSSVKRIRIPLSKNVQVLELPDFEAEYGDRIDYTINHEMSVKDIAWQKTRSALIAAKLQELKPTAMVTESWPFGKNKPYGKDLEAIIDYQEKTKVPLYGLSMEIPLYTRVPIFEPGGGSIEAASDIVAKHYSKIFMDSDGKMIRAEQLVPQMNKVKEKFVYPGYFADSSRMEEIHTKRHHGKSNKTVIVQAGAGFKPEDAVFFEKILEAREKSKLKDHNWELFVSPDCPEETFNQLIKFSAPNVHIQRNSSKFGEIFPTADFLISRSGAFTSLDILSLGMPCLFIPRPSSNEQIKRANLLAEKKIKSGSGSDHGNP